MLSVEVESLIWWRVRIILFLFLFYEEGCWGWDLSA